ncbi:phosphonate metabolism protein/1,5-bisphosphokinase (PRPP-forming) PhnN [Halovulum dunhuangense]|uniref:Ribose 1,5-bisphosphate phosphokinase PhnN n=1 Tax=Halovulum dunhuangense TaxID=1505036 RepID=A0A849L273_9RHOB|nr:phosphonate metabolism protein/1,5-bisphosphokinase (PRPP-forming) PhnN [Halovulum dunhuangense]NNU80344.1 phosphonate metabolism protein/1,5-bisphosphokinase (PRPP-forming) PhnN [Halovulum dunhuangense]
MTIADAGRLFLLVGPSGAGKDSVLSGLTARLRPEDNVALARRLITRPVIPGAPEQHVAVTPEVFARLRAAGAFALDWDSHGLSYGIGTEVEAWLDCGLSVIANGSRGALDQARTRFGARLTVVHLTAAPAILAARLAGRGRETRAEIEARLERAATLDAGLGPRVTIRNEGPLEEAIAAFHALVLDRPAPPRPGIA